VTTPTKAMSRDAPGVVPKVERAPLAALGWIGFLVAFTYIVLIAGGYLGIELTDVRQYSLAIIMVGLGTWALLAWRRPAWRPRTAIWPALLVPYAVLWLTTLTSSLPRLALDYLLWATLLVALYLLLVRMLASEYVQARLGGLLAILGLVTSIAYIAVVIGRWQQWWELVGELTPPMLRPAYAGLIVGGPTVVPVVVVLLLAGAWAGLGWDTRGRRITLSILTVTSLTAVFLAGGRGSWLALAVAIVVVGGALLLTRRDAVRQLLADRRLRFTVAGLGVLAVGVGLVMLPGLVDRLNTGGDGGRAYYVATAMRMFEDAPLLGQGPGTWPALRIAYTLPGEPDIYVPHPHNIYALTLAETGLLGIAAGAIALLAVLWLVAVALRGVDDVRRRWALAAVFGLIYLGVASLLDSYANLPVVLLLAALPIASLDATSERGVTDRLLHVGEGAQRRIHATVTVVLFGAAAVAAVALVQVERQATSHRQAVELQRDFFYAESLPAAAAAAAADPAMVPYQVTYGLAAAATGEWAAAEQAFEAAAAADDLPESWANLAFARSELDRPAAEVTEALARAQRLQDGNPYVWLTSATLYDRLGMVDESIDALGRVLAGSPSLAGDPVWVQDPWFAGRAEAAFEAALGRTGDPWQLHMFARDFEAARVAAAESADPLAPLIVAGWSGDPDAIAELQARALAAPEDPVLVPWAARVSAAAGDGEQADRFRQMVVFGLEGASLPGYETRIMSADRQEPEGALELLHGYGKNNYRRPTAGHLLAPGLPSLVLVDLAQVEGRWLVSTIARTHHISLG
jgi:O-antigen ligase